MKNTIDKLMEGNTYLRIKLYYDKGGMNYFTGKKEPRGFRISVSPVKIEGTTLKYGDLRGPDKFRVFLKEVKRYSKKTEEKLLKLLHEHADNIYEAYMESPERAAQYILEMKKYI